MGTPRVGELTANKTYFACLGCKASGKGLDSAGSHPGQGVISGIRVLPPFCPHGGFLSEMVSLNVTAVDIWGWTFLCHGDCPVFCRMFRNILRFHPLIPGETPSSVITNNMYPDIAECFIGDKSTPSWELFILEDVRTTLCLSTCPTSQ